MGEVLHFNEFRLSYGECDPAGIVYYAAYYPWMERTHNEWTYVSGIRSDRMRERWGTSTVSRASACLYERTAYLFDSMRCDMRLGDLGTTSFTMRFDFRRLDDDVVTCIGKLTLVFVDDEGRPTAVPEPMREHLLSRGEPTGMPERL